MPKFRITQSYLLQIYETCEIEVHSEDLEEFHDGCASEWMEEGTMFKRIEGDCIDDSWEIDIEEISPLDQIVEAIEAEEKA